MMKNLILILFAIAGTALLVVQCNHKEDNQEIAIETFNRDSIHAHDTTLHKVDSAMLLFEQQEAERLKNVTSIKFEKEVYDFGTCTEGDVIKKTIEFTNNGKIPLVISQAYGSCGCTIPTYDKEPMQPGKKGKLEIEFDSKNKPGANTKSVTVLANTNPEATTVSFSIKVNSKKDKKSFF